MMLDIGAALAGFRAATTAIPRAPFRQAARTFVSILAQQENEGMRDKRLLLCPLVIAVLLSAAACNSGPNVSGIWKGSIEASEKGGKNKWQGPAELTLNQNGDAITGTLVFTHPQGGRVQVPISSGVVSKENVTFSGQSQFPMGSLELTFHGTISGTSLTGTADMTSRSMLIGPIVNMASMNLTKQ
jgi:hypothetical protein